MPLFMDQDLANTPIMTEWQIVGGANHQPQLFGTHAFHEDTCIAVAEIVVVDPALRWLLALHGGYRFGGGRALARQYARLCTEKRDY